jgi:hypothetical protein
VVRWLRDNSVSALNVAGPRESEAPGIYGQALALLCAILSAIPHGEDGAPDHGCG